MTPEELEQIRTLQHIHKVKLQRLERELAKERRELKKEKAALESAKKKIQAHQQTLAAEQKRWKEKIAESAQLRSSLLEMRYSMSVLMENVEKAKKEEKKQGFVVAEVQKKIKESQQKITQQQIKIEKFVSLAED